MEAISILGREVMLPRGLTGLGTDTLDQSKEEVNEVRLPFHPNRNCCSCIAPVTQFFG